MRKRVRLYRPAIRRRARCLLAVALLLPGAGFLQAGGVNSITIVASGALLLAAAGVVYDALRPVVIVIRAGIMIAGAFGYGAAGISWNQIVRVELTGGVVSLTTTGRMLYQIEVDLRAARFLSRMAEYVLSSGRGGPTERAAPRRPPR
ncbi:MAG: hypothetical protein V3S41_09570 [Spirochaetia bacterium]